MPVMPYRLLMRIGCFAGHGAVGGDRSSGATDWQAAARTSYDVEVSRACALSLAVESLRASNEMPVAALTPQPHSLLSPAGQHLPVPSRPTENISDLLVVSPAEFQQADARIAESDQPVSTICPWFRADEEQAAGSSNIGAAAERFAGQVGDAMASSALSRKTAAPA